MANNMLWEACGINRVSFCPIPKAFEAAAAPTYVTTSGCVGPSNSFPWFILLSLHLLYPLF